MSAVLWKTISGTRIRIWSGGIPREALVQDNIAVQSHSLQGGDLIWVRREYAMELFRPLGGTFHYGLVGGHLVQSTGNRLTIRIGASSRSSKTEFASLAGKLDDVCVGIDQELARGVLDGVSQLGTRTGSGTLHFSAVASGDVGSVPAVFRSLAKGVVRGLLGAVPTDAESALAMLDD